MEKQGIISLGEAFVDYIATDRTNTKYQPFLGGATVNVAVGVSRLGIASYYLCKLGTDEKSRFVEEELHRVGVSTDYCVRTPTKQICGVYVHITEKGEREFHSYINQTPDEVLTAEQLEKSLFKKARVFYFGSGTLFHPTALETTKVALGYAQKSKCMVAFDANLRQRRWESEEQCRETVMSFVGKADVVKLAEDELRFLTKTDSVAEGIEAFAKLGIRYLFITVGSEGAYVVVEGKSAHVPGEKVQAVDTTGAGDAFMATLIGRFYENENPTFKQVLEYTSYANHIGALASMKVGATEQ
ncbi:carbohydrate kinase family protein [Mesobacillus maritimus]|uniref:carbohydrate kinase family protein n=1 Tax=Mesobacillus maritimus TaxID=1643336 RepID=UPI00384F06D1